MDNLTTTNAWELELSFFPKAAEKGLRPVRIPFGDFLSHSNNPDDEIYWTAYTPHTFLFKNPPSREDFWALVKQTPWMIGYESHKSLVDSNDWPMIDWMLKAAHVELKDLQGRVAGRINISRNTVYTNDAYDTAPITHDAIDRVCNRAASSGQSYAQKDAIRGAENKLKERLSKLDHSPTQGDVEKAIRDYLAEIGMKPGSRNHKLAKV